MIKHVSDTHTHTGNPSKFISLVRFFTDSLFWSCKYLTIIIYNPFVIPKYKSYQRYTRPPTEKYFMLQILLDIWMLKYTLNRITPIWRPDHQQTQLGPHLIAFCLRFVDVGVINTNIVTFYLGFNGVWTNILIQSL